MLSVWSSTLRSIRRDPVYSALNLASLMLGLAVAFILGLSVLQDLRQDKDLPGVEAIYRLNQTQALPGQPATTTAATPGVLLPTMIGESLPLAAGARIRPYEVEAEVGDARWGEAVQFVDPGFAEVFPLPMVEGRMTAALRDTMGLALSETAANRLLGAGGDRVGRRVILTVDGVERPYEVRAIFRDRPSNSHLALNAIARLDRSVFAQGDDEAFERWLSSSFYTYVRLPAGATAEALAGGLAGIAGRHGGGEGDWAQLIEFEPSAVAGIRLRDGNVQATAVDAVDPRVVWIMAGVALGILVIAVVNYVNLATARAGRRAREVAVRKALGATTAALRGAFLAEALILTTFAALAALVLAVLALPWLNQAFGADLALGEVGWIRLAASAAFVTLLAGLAAGVYPAFVLSAFQPAALLAASRSDGSGGRGGQRFREALVIVQFATTAAMLTATMIAFQQVRHITRVNPGFERDGLLLVESAAGLNAPARNAFMTAAAASYGRDAVAASDRWPAGGGETRTNVGVSGRSGPEPSLVREIVSGDYFGVVGSRLLAGRRLAAGGMDDIALLEAEAQATPQVNIVLNRAAVEALGLSSPDGALGLRLSVHGPGGPVTGVVVGVVADMRFNSPRETVPPVYYLQSSEPTSGSAVFTRAASEPRTAMEGLRAAWDAAAADGAFDARPAEAAVESFVAAEQRRIGLFTLGSVLSGVIAGAGLYGLAGFAARRRRREMAIRKALGATSATVTRLLLTQLLRPILLALMIGTPAAAWMMSGWLQGYATRASIGASALVAPAMTILVLAVATILVQAWTLASEAPGQALGDD